MNQIYSRVTAFCGVVLILASIFLSLSLVTPSPASADPGIMKWDTVITPGSVVDMFDVVNPHYPPGTDNPKGSDILSMAAGKDGRSISLAVRTWYSGSYQNLQFYSNNNGISWQIKTSGVFQVINTAGKSNYLTALVGDTNGPKVVMQSPDGGVTWNTVFDGSGLEAKETIRAVDISPDYSVGGSSRQDIGFVTIGGSNGGRWIVVSSDGLKPPLAQLNANGTAADPLTNPATPTHSGIDYLAIKFSPNYPADGSVALVYADPNATYYNIAYRDAYANTTTQYAFGSAGIEVKNPASPAGSSPGWSQLDNVCLELPSDFSGQAPSARRAYISLDAYNSASSYPPRKLPNAQDGIFRIDDSVVYVLMDTSSTMDKSIYSIAYFGTYASGKLLAGERMGYPCSATVPTWFTDSPTTCPIPCWYPALKPTTGAAGGQGSCSAGAKNGIGAAQVDWNVDGSLALASTGSLAYTVYMGQGGRMNGHPLFSSGDRRKWFQMLLWDPVANDESAFAISRNNGETWNQLSMIDTTIDWFNDVAVAPDCSTIYLASVNRNLGRGCSEFDSVWRTTLNPNVSAPLPAIPPLGTYWERVYCRPTAYDCSGNQSDLPILRVVSSCSDRRDGEIVGWAAQNASTGSSGNGVMAWSPDYGDYWANITPRYPVQDFCFTSDSEIYVLSANGIVQRLPYTGTAWSTTLPGYDTTLLAAHTIAATPDGNVIVGAGLRGSYPFAYSQDRGITFNIPADNLAVHGDEHVIFDVNYKDNKFIYMGDDAASPLGTVYRQAAPDTLRFQDNDMMNALNGGKYVFADEPELAWPAGDNPPHPVGIFGLLEAWSGSPQAALYAAHAPVVTSIASENATGQWNPFNSAVCRTLRPLDGMPKPGIQWACLDIFAPLATNWTKFTLEPNSLKACGCCNINTNITLYAIDDQTGNWSYAGGVRTGYALNRGGRWNNHLNNAAVPWDLSHPGYTPSLNQGMLWAYTDCLGKKGPVLKAPTDKFLVGADPVTGRNQQIDLSWEQLCLSTWYQLQIGKDADFLERVNPGQGGAGMGNSAINITATTGSILLKMDSYNMTSPAAWLAPGALPEAGAIYYWRVRSAKTATQQIADSPWSDARSFTVKAGSDRRSRY